MENNSLLWKTARHQEHVFTEKDKTLSMVRVQNGKFVVTK